jgi:cell division protein FtsA
MKKEIITGLDLGSTKVCAVIAERNENGKFHILGVGTAKCDGLVRGEVSNIIRTADAIKEAVGKAELKANQKVTIVKTGVSGENISSIRSRNYVNITNEDQVVTADDLKRLKTDLQGIQFSKDMRILHILHEEFFVDRQGIVTNPLGVACSRLEASNHVVMASVSAIMNINKAIKKAGYEVGEMMLQSLASSSAVLEAAEKDLGVLLIDIGGGTTDVMIYQGHAIRYSRVYGIAGSRITGDIKETLNVVNEDAEELKLNYGYATETAIVRDDLITVKGVGPRPNTKIPVSLLTQIIKSRVAELFKIINVELEKSEVKNKVHAGIVITGGGALLKGITDLAEQIFGLPARLGFPSDDYFTGDPHEISKPELATALGLLLPVEEEFVSDDELEAPKTEKKPFWRSTKLAEPKKRKEKKSSGSISELLKSIKRTFDDL